VKTWKENKWRNKEKTDDNKKQNQVENGIEKKKKLKETKKHLTNDQTMERAETETDTMKKNIWCLFIIKSQGFIWLWFIINYMRYLKDLYPSWTPRSLS
jgi:hypothetical protein